MILQELCSLYDRLSQDPELRESIPEPGWSREKVAWALVIDLDGRILGLQPLGDDKQRYREMLVPEHARRSGTSATPYFLCDKASYFLGLDEKNGQGNRARSRKLHQEILAGYDDDGARSVLAFFSMEDPTTRLEQDDLERLGDGKMVVLCLRRSSGPVFNRPAVREAWRNYIEAGGETGGGVVGHCSVTGREAPLARLFPQVTGIPGVQSSGASLVSFNFGASTSYGKTQAYNASMSEDAAFRAGTALKYLLGDRSRRVALGGTIMTYWTDAPAPVADAALGWVLGKGSGNLAEDKSARDALSSALEEMRRGSVPASFDPKVGYCILGITPNKGRLSVRYFVRGALGDLARALGDYARDIEMARVEGFTTPWQILLQTSPDGKRNSKPYERLKKMPQTMIAQTMQAVFGGGEFPRALETLVLARMRTDHGDKGRWDLGQRAAILKACRNRRLRLRGLYLNEKERVDVSLNKENSNLGYLTGRLFAVLERAQQGAIEDANATIRDRYIGAASTTPARVMQPLLRLCQAHLTSIRKDEKKMWLAVRLERELDEIVGRLMPGDEGFPKTLDSDDQGMFFIGYYQERCALWEKSDKRSADRGTSGEQLNEASANTHSEEE